MANTLFQTIGSGSGTQIADPNELLGVSLATSVGSSNLTITLNNANGATPDSANPVKVAFRNLTLTNGSLVERTIETSLTVTVGSGSTLGHISGYECPIYVYLADLDSIDGTQLLCVSTYMMDETRLYDINNGADGSSADLEYLIYHSRDGNTYVSRPIKLIGILLSTQTVAGTWAAVPTVASPGSIPSLILKRNNILTATTHVTLTITQLQTIDTIFEYNGATTAAVYLPDLKTSYRRKLLIKKCDSGAAPVNVIPGVFGQDIEGVAISTSLYNQYDYISLVAGLTSWFIENRKQTVEFKMTCSGSVINSGATGINCPTLLVNYGSGATTGSNAQFIAPVRGIYQFFLQITCGGVSISPTNTFVIRIGGTLSGSGVTSFAATRFFGTGSNIAYEINCYALVSLDIGDQVHPTCAVATGATTGANDALNYFAGCLVQPL